jgi:hypothetical protein
MPVLGTCQFEGEPHEATEYFEVASNHRPPRWWALCRDHAAFVSLALEPPNSNRLDVLVKQSEAGLANPSGGELARGWLTATACRGTELAPGYGDSGRRKALEALALTRCRFWPSAGTDDVSQSPQTLA